MPRLGLKQTQRNPWEVFAETHPVGSIIEGEVKNITEFGLFVGLPGNIDGFVHVSDLYWDGSTEYVISDFPKGATVQALVMEVDVRKERISLSIKATGDGRYSSQTGEVKRGSIITVEVTKIEEGGIEVIYEGIRAFIRRSELSLDRADQRPERFLVGSKMEVFVTNAFSNSKRLDLSIKALERAEQKDAIARYGSSGSGATLGEILGAALKSGSSRKPR